MNTSALAIAVLGLIGVVISINLDRWIANKTLGLVVRIVGVLGSLSLLVMLPADDATVYATGEYFAVLGIVALIAWFLFFKKKMKA